MSFEGLHYAKYSPPTASIRRKAAGVDEAVPDFGIPSAPETQPLWADEAQLGVRRVALPDGVPAHTVDGIVTEVLEIGVTGAEAAYYARAVAWDEDRQVFNDYVFTERRTELQWGASASAVTWIVEVAESVGKEALFAGLLYAVHKIRRGIVDRVNMEPLTLDVAEGKARQAVALIYDVSADALTRRGDSRSSDGREVTVSFSHDGGHKYRGRVTLLGGLYLTTEVERLEA